MEFSCRIMETRNCPGGFSSGCGEGLCARLESDSEIPWARTEKEFAAAFEKEIVEFFGQARTLMEDIPHTWDRRDPETGRHYRNGHTLQLTEEVDWYCVNCLHRFPAAVDANLYRCGAPFAHQGPESN